MRILKVVLESTSKVYWKSCYNKIKRCAYFVKHFINDLAGLFNTSIFCPMLMDSRFALHPLTLGKKISVCLICQLNRLECLTRKHVI